MQATLLHGGHVVTDPAALPDGGVIANGRVLVVGENVEAVGPFDDGRKTHSEVEVLGSQHHLILPGLINAHDHGAGVMAPNSEFATIIWDVGCPTTGACRRSTSISIHPTQPCG